MCARPKRPPGDPPITIAQLFVRDLADYLDFVHETGETFRPQLNPMSFDSLARVVPRRRPLLTVCRGPAE